MQRVPNIQVLPGHLRRGEPGSLWQEVPAQPRRPPVSRGSRGYIQWAQRSLNQLLGTRLAVDGIVGKQTRSAIRSFQQQRRLLVDGVVGPQTEGALIAAGAPPPDAAPARVIQLPEVVICTGPAFWVLDEFGFDQAALSTRHVAEIEAIAKEVVASSSSARQIDTICLEGHADERGTEEHNFQLGLRRAASAQRQLVNAIIRQSKGSRSILGQVKIEPSSGGELFPITSNLAAEGRACNRRVEVLISRAGTLPAQSCTCADFFAQYDLRFEPTSPTRGVPGNPNLTAAEKAVRIADVQAMVAALLPRRDARAAAALAGGILSPAPAPSALVPAVRRLSAGQLELFRQCLPDGAGGIAFSAFQRCFEQFANGELRNPGAGAGVGEPNSGFYFLFAEFAFLSIESNIDRFEWTRLLRVLVMTQEIFIHVYRPPPRPAAPPAVDAPLPGGPVQRGLDDFSDANFSATGQSDAARKAALRAKYDPMGLCALRGSARDNMIRAQRMP